MGKSGGRGEIRQAKKKEETSDLTYSNIAHLTDCVWDTTSILVARKEWRKGSYGIELGLTLSGKQHQLCAASSCGKVTDISYPFRLKQDPKNCGDPRYELDCINNVTVLLLNSAEYHVEVINYKNYTIRLVDPGIQEVDSYQANIKTNYTWTLISVSLFKPIIYLSCAHPVNDDPYYVDTTPCLESNTYAIVGEIDLASWKAGCHVKAVSPTSWTMPTTSTTTVYGDADADADANANVSYVDIHRQLVYGFEISWMQLACDSQCGSRPCYFDTTIGTLQCYIDNDSRCYYINGGAHSCGILVRIGVYTKASLSGILTGLYWLITFRAIHLDNANAINRAIAVGYYGLPSFVVARFLFGATLLIAILIHKWRRRHLSVYQNIESFLQDYDLMPIRYSYKEIKKMTSNFNIKLGQGGFGSVYKGKLRSGHYVAIKMLGKSIANGQEFISEVATIGKIHHVNVVRLIGYCVEESKRALVYEFMPNSSLDKYIFSKEGSISLSFEKIYEISLAIARGIAYLHQGCDMQILHFDIKPHNILLDENFIPKVSDFGLAKLYPMNDSIVTLTAARGTLGYMAPELFYKNIGGISYKADIYSFGMLLMEMAGKRRNSNPQAEHSSQAYFPHWIYDQFSEDKDVDIEDATEEEKKMVKKMFITALWCIQLKPRDRPSMNKVVEMLEGEMEGLEMPPRPSFYPEETVAENLRINSDGTTTNDVTASTSTSCSWETSNYTAKNSP
ncbi:LEAF RUST 10 DISEASE-RESISTANCE LOCUS RECEPTOR-LIKE PROTEIN KINASE-like 2.1 [Senna tora]|uniref:LEAF RUST 10 DISEASE-RESISTANCE LOCUS RECEPTOR-LIKE PROTEIN KINASE-like 2.1 n=1 Tax=Senna tora TaxID=362788 RepID=A0A834WD65_9FABA|nr:LEAF RUST 10 DISEASE-RESISTANCE LOCUS RECEPTOR-LIKE PROTEIN KINASE-like 2.1 [Senna tora]